MAKMMTVAAALSLLTLVVASAAAYGSWTARLRVVPEEDLGLEVGLLYDAEDRPMGRLRDLQFEIRNVSDELMKIDWDASALQLPGTQGRHVVRPEVLFEAENGIMLVPAGAGKTLRVCSTQHDICDSTWLDEARLNEDFSLALRLSVASPDERRVAEWRWDFDYEEDAAVEEASEDRSPAIIVTVAAAVIFALLLLL